MHYQQWRDQIRPEKKKRNYQHIDSPIDISDERSFRKVISVIENIKDHQFLPFIKRNEIKIRFRKDKTGKVVRSSKIRPIKYASHIDSHIYSYYNYLVMNKYEDYLKNNNLSENVIAYRRIPVNDTKKGKNNIYFAKEVFDHISKQDDCVVITQDIEGFFDNLNHKRLKNNICRVFDIKELDNQFYKVFKSLTLYKYIEYDDFISDDFRKQLKNNKYPIYRILKGLIKENRVNKGIPQGSPISGSFANIYLVDFDSEIKLHFPEVFYRRYSDDLVFVCNRETVDRLLDFVDKKIKECLLSINKSKSYISHFKKIDDCIFCEKVTYGDLKPTGRTYVDYLGFEYNGKNINFRKYTIQKLKHKQKKKAERQLLNKETQKRRRPKKHKVIRKSSNYLKIASDVINSDEIKKQILKISRGRNSIKNIKTI